MRKITKKIANAFAQGESLTIGNTRTAGGRVFLHGNCIVETDPWGKIEMSLAGWNTVTTRERLNGIAEVLGLEAKFTQKDFEPYLNGKYIADNMWYVVHGKTLV